MKAVRKAPPAIVSRSPDGERVFVLDSGFAALRVAGSWTRDAEFTGAELADFDAVTDEAEASKLVREARIALSS